ncbi:glycosyl hydrolase [Carboxylicivirga sp. M1479]|uniref:VPS10 domain-containing protein n=1 Tax=Carboxylicivirga sp. M1479 TaxID=2594476 RepID=UPI001178B83B|nr:glycosyl hydrolase [Carboxylicivirga sp. M1479]TRX71428.1 glycosyl hydrolase [Carboxylicivirga sp. M1479]
MPKTKSKAWIVVSILSIALMAFSLQSFAQKNKKKSSSDSEAFALTSEMLNMYKFRNIGPAAYSGRISDFAVNPANTSEYYVAVASGGLWKTTNHGTTFEPIFDDQPVFSIGCLAMDPNNANVVWVGTGENNTQRNLAYGDGVYKTTDGGKSFTNMGLKTSSQIGKIMIDPRNSNVVYVASQGQAWGPGGERGLYKTTDGGQSWERMLEIGEYTGISDLEMDPRNPDILYAASHQRERRVWSKINGGPESAIYKSVDAGACWTKLKKGLPGGDVGRIGLALSPANPDIIYAVIELPGNKGGVYRSNDMGESWEKRSDKVSGSPQYYNELYAAPYDPDMIILMDTRAARSLDGGRTWENIEGKNKHVDNHAIWMNPEDPNHYIMGCDGGIYETYDAAKTWQFASNLPITQYYHVRTDNEYPFYNVYGGAQDNGSWFGPSQTHRQNIVNADWTYAIGGDGYLSIPDPKNPDIHYCESQYCGIRRYDRTTGNSISIQPQPTIDEEYRWNWNTPYLLSHFDNKTLYIGGNYVLKSTDMGGTWEKISADLTRQIDQNSLPMMGKIWPPEAVAKNMSTSKFGNIFALTESPLKQGMLYAGTDDGLIWITEDDGANWTKYDTFTGVPDMTFVNYITPSMHNENVVYACFDGRKNSSDFTPYLIKSTDKGKTWTSIASNLPSGTVYCIQEDHVNPDLLFIGTEWGVWTSIDGGEKWVQIKNGLPTIQVKELTIQQRENDLVVATFGRGFYVLDNYSALRTLSEEISEKEAHLFEVNDALLYFPSSNLRYQGEVHFRTPNPEPETKFEYYIKTGYKSLKDKRKEAQKEAKKSGGTFKYATDEELLAEEQEVKPQLIFTIYDANDNIMRKLSSELKKGYNTLSWDLAYLTKRGPKVPPGAYKVAIDKNMAGTFTRLVDKQAFNVVSIPNALGTANYNANFEFLKEVSDLNAQVSAARAKIKEMNTRLKNLKTILAKTPVEANVLVNKVDELQKEIDAITKVIIGGFGAKNSVNSRIRFAMYTTSYAHVDVTGAQKEQYAMALQAYQEQEATLDALFKTKVPALEGEVEEAGGVLYNTSSGSRWW